MYSGRKAFQIRLECEEIVLVENFTGLDDTERGFERWLYTPAGIGRVECRGETVAVAGIRSCPCRKDGKIIQISLLLSRVPAGGRDHRSPGPSLKNIISTASAAENTRQKQRYYENDSFHDINLGKYRNFR